MKKVISFFFILSFIISETKAQTDPYHCEGKHRDPNACDEYYKLANDKISFQDILNRRIPNDNDLRSAAACNVQEVEFGNTSYATKPNFGDKACSDKVNNLLEKWKSSDSAKMKTLVMEAYTHLMGQVQKEPGICEAGAPPPCCPCEHWMTDPNAWQKYLNLQKEIYDKRLKQIKDIMDACCKTRQAEQQQQTDTKYNTLVSNGNDAYQKGKESEAKGNYTEASKYYAESRTSFTEAAKLKPNESAPKEKIAQIDKQSGQVKKEESALATQQKKQEQEKLAEQQRIVNEQNKKEFEEKKQQVVNKQNEYNRAEQQTMTNMGLLAAVWVGMYMLKEPVSRNYNYKGGFFSWGPTNSFISAPHYLNSREVTTYDHSQASNVDKDEVETTIENVNTVNFGVKAEFGYLSDAVHLTIPVKINYGILTDQQSNFNFGGGLNLFVGSRNWKKFKLGACFEYSNYSMSKLYSNSTVADWYVWDKTATSSSDFAISTFKFGFRSQKNFNSQEINSKEPFVFDLFYTMNFIDETTFDMGYNTYIPLMAPGIELNVARLGVFGFYAKAIFMTPVGSCTYYNDTGVQTNNAGSTVLPSTFKLGDSGAPYFEIGIKKEYCWFRNHK